jgi:hypothetical protein
LGNVTYLNLVAEAMTGWSREDALGRPLRRCSRIIDGTTRQAAANPAQRAIGENRTVGLAADCVLCAVTGPSRHRGFRRADPQPGRSGHRRGDRLPRRQRITGHGAEDGPSGPARFLTGLPNRVLLTERLSQAIGLARRRGKQVALLFLDLDYVSSTSTIRWGMRSATNCCSRLPAAVRVCARHRHGMPPGR